MLFSSWLRSWKTTLARSPQGCVRRQHKKSHPSRFRLGLECLEDRSLLSTAVISGPPTATDMAVNTDSPYTLHLIASEPASQWTINWGDGNIQNVSGNPTEVTHAYTTGQVVRNISATALINGQTVVANTSDEGKDLGAFGQIPGNYIVFGPDFTGDHVNDLYATRYDSLSVYDGVTGAFVQQLSTRGGGVSTIGPDGDLYYATGNSDVLRYDFATSTVSTFVPSGSGGLSGVGGLAFGHDANGDGTPELYVSSDGPEQILRYDGATGQSLGALVSNLHGPRGVAFGSDGNMYFTNDFGNNVQRYDFSTGTLSTFVSSGSGGLTNPGALTFGPDGDLYVVSKLDSQTLSYGSFRVLHYDGVTGNYLSTISGWGRNDGTDVIESVRFGPDNNLYTSWNVAPLTTAGTVAPSAVERFAGPLTPAAGTQLPVTVLKTFQKTYSSSKSLTIPENGSAAASTITVPDAGTILDVNVKLSITHPNDSDLEADLYAPNGAKSLLFGRIGGSGDNFTNTVLDDEPLTAPVIDSAAAPFTGTFRPQGSLANLDGGPSNGTWTLWLRDYVKGNKGTLNNWSITVTYGIGPAALSASSVATASTAPALSKAEMQPLVQEAARRWEAAGLPPQQAAALQSVNVQTADLGGATLGMASGHTIWIDTNAAGWGWFVDKTPRSDREFTTPGNQGEQGKIDLLTVLAHEMGHLLGLEHSSTAGDVMDATLTPGLRLMPAASDLLGSTQASAPLPGNKEGGKEQIPLHPPTGSRHGLDTIDAVFADLAQRADHERAR